MIQLDSGLGHLASVTGIGDRNRYPWPVTVTEARCLA